MLEWFIGNVVWLLLESNLKFLWHVSWAFASEDGKCWCYMLWRLNVWSLHSQSHFKFTNQNLICSVPLQEPHWLSCQLATYCMQYMRIWNINQHSFFLCPLIIITGQDIHILCFLESVNVLLLQCSFFALWVFKTFCPCIRHLIDRPQKQFQAIFWLWIRTLHDKYH